MARLGRAQPFKPLVNSPHRGTVTMFNQVRSFSDAQMNGYGGQYTAGITTLGSLDKQVTSSAFDNPYGLLVTVVAGTTVTLNSASFYAKAANTARAAAVHIYSGSAGSRGSLLYTSSSSNLSSTSYALETRTFTAATLTAGTYWIDVDIQPIGSGSAFVAYETGGASNTSYTTSDVGVLTYGTDKPSMYITYTIAPRLAVLSMIRGFGRAIADYIMNAPAPATSSGPFGPSTTVDDATVGTLIWGSPNNAQASDNVYATCTIDAVANSHYLKATNFGFSVPIGATINGILVEVQKKKAGTALITDNMVNIVKSNGSFGTTNKADTITAWPTSEAYASYGSSSDLWGETWTSADINNANFGVGISANFTISMSTNASIDYIRTTVYYTPQPRLTILSSVFGYGRSLSASIMNAASRSTTVTRALTMARTLSDSIMNAVSRLATVSRVGAFARTLSDSIMNAASRLAVVTKGVARSLSDSIMNAAARLTTVSRIFNGVRAATVSMMNSASRLATVARIFTGFRTLTVSMMNSAARLATLSRVVTFTRNLNDGIMNSVARLTTLFRSVGLTRTFSDSIMNSVSRLATVVRVKGFIRNLSDSIAIGAARLVTLFSRFLPKRDMRPHVLLDKSTAPVVNLQKQSVHVAEVEKSPTPHIKL